MYCVYVIKSIKNGTYYKGLTNNLDRRVNEHDSGKTSSNKAIKPFKLIFVQEFEGLPEARRFEKFLKSGYGREVIREIDS